MSQPSLKNFCFFETNSLGSSYRISQKLAAKLPHKIFEASVTPSGSILVITFEMDLSASQIKNLLAEADLQASIKSWHLSLATSQELIDGYLNQTMRPLNGNLVVVEGDLFSAVLPVVESMILADLQIIEFRILRSAKNVFCISFDSTFSDQELKKIISEAKQNLQDLELQNHVHVSLITKPNSEIRSQYTI